MAGGAWSTSLPMAQNLFALVYELSKDPWLESRLAFQTCSKRRYLFGRIAPIFFAGPIERY